MEREHPYVPLETETRDLTPLAKNEFDELGIQPMEERAYVSKCLNTSIYSILETSGECTIKLFTAVIYRFL
jgi:hypothetical protein